MSKDTKRLPDPEAILVITPVCNGWQVHERHLTNEDLVWVFTDDSALDTFISDWTDARVDSVTD